MIAIDTNILVYAHRKDSQWHSAAFAALERLVLEGKPFAIPWPCVHEFIAVVTHPSIYKPPTPLKDALGALQIWMSCPSANMLGEGPGYFKKLESLALSGKIKGARIHDARIAALCLNHGVRELWTADRDFSAYRQLIFRNPLIKS